MNKMFCCLAIIAVGVGMPKMDSWAQERRPEVPVAHQPRAGHAGRGPEGGFSRMGLLFTALDTNGDGVLSAEEINNAPTALRKLDKNGDGKITTDELHMNFARPGGERERGPSPAGTQAGEMVRRLMEYDKNGDGKLSKDELPERMQTLFDQGDMDKDGFLTKDEIQKLAEARAAAAGGAAGTREGRMREGRGEREHHENSEHRPERPASDK